VVSPAPDYTSASTPGRKTPGDLETTQLHTVTFPSGVRRSFPGIREEEGTNRWESGGEGPPNVNDPELGQQQTRGTAWAVSVHGSRLCRARE